MQGFLWMPPDCSPRTYRVFLIDFYASIHIYMTHGGILFYKLKFPATPVLLTGNSAPVKLKRQDKFNRVNFASTSLRGMRLSR